jgi:hypothetical protein
MELMDRKMDPGADKTRLPSVAERLQDGSLPLGTALGGSGLLLAMDKLLQLEVSGARRAPPDAVAAARWSQWLVGRLQAVVTVVQDAALAL